MSQTPDANTRTPVSQFTMGSLLVSIQTGARVSVRPLRPGVGPVANAAFSQPRASRPSLRPNAAT